MLPKKLNQSLHCLLLASAALVSAALLSATGCSDFEPQQPLPSEESFGQKFFTIACQRVAYTSAQRARELDPSLPVDVSGSRYRYACRYGADLLPADAAQQAPKVSALVAHRPELVEAVDLMFPKGELSDLQDYMISILPLTDNDAFPDLIRKGGAVVHELQQDQALNWGLARLDGRDGYRPREVCFGIMREALGYDKLYPTLNTLLGFVGPGGKGHDALLDLMDAASFEMRSVKMIHDPTNAKPEHPGAPDRTLRLAIDLLLTKHSGFGGGLPVPVVLRDWRGLAKVHRNPQTGKLPAPFVDANADGLADIDSVLGRYVTQPANAAIPEPFHYDPGKADPAPSRDALGQALDGSGAPIYEYANLDGTLLAALGRDGIKLMDPQKRTGFRLLLGASPLLGPTKELFKKGAGDEILSYVGYDVARSPLLDLLYGALQLGRDPGFDATLEAATLLMKHHENETARLVAALREVSDLSKAAVYNGAKMDPQSNFFDDLIDVLRKVAVRDNGKLLKDLLVAFGDPRTRNLGAMMGNYMKYRDVHVLDSSGKKIQNPQFKVLVNRNASDSDHNRSIQQRLNHIIHDTFGMKMCNKPGSMIRLHLLGNFGVNLAGPFDECELFEIPDGAVFYTESIARLRDSSGKLTDTPKGHLRLKTENMPGWLATIINTVGPDTVLSVLSGIDGMSSHPTTEAINRLMFMDPLPDALADMQDPAICVDGHQVNKEHVGSLLSWEVPHPQFSCSTNDPCQFFDAIRPVVQAFADHDAEDLFLELLSVTHVYWSSKQSSNYQFTDPQKPNYSAAANLVSYEPLLLDILLKTDLMHALNAAAPVLTQLKLKNGKPAVDALVSTIAYLLDPQRSPGLTYRDGTAQSRTTDGKKVIPGGVSPFYLLADAWTAKTRAMEAADKTSNDAWDQSTTDLLDIFLEVQGNGSSARFANRRLVPAGEVLVNFLRQRLAAHRQAGDLVQWLRKELMESLGNKLASPVVPRAVHFLRVAEESPEVVVALHEMLGYLLDEANNNLSFRSSLTSIADMAQLLLDDTDLVPVVRALGRALAPERGVLKAALRFLAPAVAADTRQSLTNVLRNAYKEQRPGKSPMQTLLDVVFEVHRTKPGCGEPYDGPDVGEALREAGDFLAQQETGLIKFFEIVKDRCGGPCSSGQ